MCEIEWQVMNLLEILNTISSSDRKMKALRTHKYTKLFMLIYFSPVNIEPLVAVSSATEMCRHPEHDSGSLWYAWQWSHLLGTSFWAIEVGAASISSTVPEQPSKWKSSISEVFMQFIPVLCLFFSVSPAQHKNPSFHCHFPITGFLWTKVNFYQS